MRASEAEIQGDTPDRASGFKVFGRPGHEQVDFDEVPPEFVAASTQADDPFAALADDESDVRDSRPPSPAPHPAKLAIAASVVAAPLVADATETRPDWYRDPAFWVHAIPLAGSVLILTGVGLVPGLLIENTAGRRDDFVRDQARESVNFQLNYLLLNLAALITFTAPVVWPLSLAFGIVLPIQAALDVKQGRRHRYPLVPRWLD